MIILKPKNIPIIFGMILAMILSISGEILLAYNLGNLINHASTKDSNSLIVSVITTILIIIIYPFTLYFYDLLKHKSVYILSYNLKQKLFESILHQDYLDFEKTDVGEKVSIFINDVEMIENDYFLSLIDLCRRSILFLISFISIILISLPLGILLLCLSISSIYITKLIGKDVDTLKKNVSSTKSDFVDKLTEYLNGYKVINSFGIEDSVSQQFMTINKNLLESLIAFRKRFSKTQSFSMFLGGLTFMGAFVFGSYLVYLNLLTVGALITSIQLSNNITQPIYLMTNALLGIQSVKKIKEKIQSIFKIIPVFKESFSISKREDIISLENIFYQVDKHQILKDINLKLENGKKYLLLGGSGSGKTTLLNIIFGRLNPSEGNRYIGENFDVDKAFMEQDTFLFSGSLKDNIQLFDSSISDESIKESLEIVDLQKWHHILEDKEFIKENGQNLSGGEKQRIALCRILARQKKIILSDESTSSLDLKNVFMIENHLLSLEGFTVIFCTHKVNLDNVQKYDKIIFMKNGTLLGCDHFDKLIKNCSDFEKFIYISD